MKRTYRLTYLDNRGFVRLKKIRVREGKSGRDARLKLVRGTRGVACVLHVERVMEKPNESQTQEEDYSQAEA